MATSTDSRAQGNIDKIGQIEGILRDPFRYAGILLKCMVDNMLPRKAYRYLESMAYFGQGNHYIGDMLVLTAVTLLDRVKETSLYIGRRLIILLCSLSVVVLAMTSMYIVFTALGADTILGFQGRYMLPALFPVLYVLRLVKERPQMNRNHLALLTLSWFTADFLLSIWYFSVYYY